MTDLTRSVIFFHLELCKHFFPHFFDAIQLQIKKPHKPIYRFYQSLFLQNNFFKIVNKVFFSPITALTAHSKMPLV